MSLAHRALPGTILIFVLCSSPGCDFPRNPDELLIDAQAAYAWHEHDDALRIAETLVIGDDPRHRSTRFAASLIRVKCLFVLGPQGEALDRFEAIYDEFPTEMAEPRAYRHAIDVIQVAMFESHGPLIWQRAFEIASSRHPEKGRELAALRERFLHQLDEGSARHPSRVLEIRRQIDINDGPFGPPGSPAGTLDADGIPH